MTDLSDNLTTEETETEPGNNRRDLFRKIAIAGAGAAVGSAILSGRADAADDGNLQIGSSATAVTNNKGTTPTVLTYAPPATPAFPATGASLLSAAENAPGPITTATAGVNLFPAALGGYAVSNIKNGVHGSTKAIDGFGVVAANVAAPDAAKDAPKAMAIGSFGSHIQFLTAKTVATAAGVTPVPADVVGPSLGKHVAGELYVDDAYNLWFSVPTGTAATDPVRWVKLAGKATAGSFVALPSPVRVYDSREGTVGKLAGGQERVIDLTTGKKGTTSIPGIAAGATAAAINLTVDATTASGFVSVYADGATFNDTSNANWAEDGQVAANYVVSAVSDKGKVKVRGGGAGTTHVIIDVTGYYL
jgi:hypothetical protein